MLKLRFKVKNLTSHLENDKLVVRDRPSFGHAFLAIFVADF
jgi:hypothetical protein